MEFLLCFLEGFNDIKGACCRGILGGFDMESRTRRFQNSDSLFLTKVIQYFRDPCVSDILSIF